MRKKYFIRAVAWICCLMLTGAITSLNAQEAGTDTTRGVQEEIVSVPVTEEEEAVEDIGLAIGDEAPKFALRDLEGNYELLTKWSGVRLSRPASQPVRHVVVASFFATWCEPCMKELPHLQNLYGKYSNEDLKIFLIDITEATRSVEGYENSPLAGPFLKEKGITIPVLDDIYGMTKKSYGVTTLPRLFVIDKFRKVRLIKQGFHEGEDFEGELAGVIEELLGEGSPE